MKHFVFIRPLLHVRKTSGANPGDTSKGDIGKGDSGDPKKTSGDGKDSSLTQEQVNGIIAKERRSWQVQFDTEKSRLQSEIEGLKGVKTELDEFKKLFEEAAAEVGDETTKRTTSSGIPLLDEIEDEVLSVPAGVKDKETWLRLKRAQFIQNKQLSVMSDELVKTRKTLEDLTKQAGEERERRERAESSRLETLRDSVLNQALVKANCIDPEAGVLLLRDRVTYDAKLGRHTYTTKDGEPLTVSDGVIKEMPSYLKRAASETGGSGSGSGHSVSDQELTGLEATAKQAEAAARQRPNDMRAMGEYQRAKRALNDAKLKKAATR